MNNLLQSLIGNSWFELAARWILGLTFIYASIHKILAPAEFAKIVYGYDLFPAVLINLIAIVIPLLEMITGLALVFGVYPRSAAIIVNGMLMAYIIAVTINLIRGHQFDCGCFSFGESGFTSATQVSLARNVIYFILGLQVILFSGIRKARLFIRRPSNIF